MLTRRALLTASLALAATNAVRAQTPPAALTTLRLSSSPVDDVMPVLFAQQNGAFRKAGLDVQLTRASSGSAIAAAVLGGAVDIGKSGVASILSAHAKGVPLVFIAPASVYDTNSPDGALVVAAASPFRTAKDMNGKIVAVPALNDLNTVATRAWIDRNGGDASTVKFVEIPAAAQAAALEGGRIDAAALVNPYLAGQLNGGKGRILGKFYDAIAESFMLSGWFTTREFIEKNRDAVVKFVRIVGTTGTYTNAHKSETVPLLATWSSLAPDEAARLPRMTNGIRLSAQLIQPMIEASVKAKLIPATFDAHEIMFDAGA
jgi:NitT/TauT family transport system substrate-binding protein